MTREGCTHVQHTVIFRRDSLFPPPASGQCGAPLMLPAPPACLLTTGCASSTASDKVPKGTLAIATQAGPIGFLAPTKGTVYILDVDDDRLLSSTPVDAGVKLLFNPQRLNSNHVHRLYFQKG
jgi:hypothetical protein